MKVLYNKNDEKDMKALMGLNLRIMEKRIDLLLVATQPTELSILTTAGFQDT